MMLVKINSTHAINPNYVLWVESCNGVVKCVVGRIGGHCGPEHIVSDFTLDYTIKLINDSLSNITTTP